jgi:pilus assembly protein Flp/PilA
MTKLFSRFLRDEAGATAIEYSLICAILGAAVIAGISSFRGDLLTALGSIGDTITSETAKK